MHDRKWGHWVLGAAGIAGVLGLWLATRDVCVSAYLLHGVEARRCPDGEVHQTLRASANFPQRGKPGFVTVGATAHFTTGESDRDATGLVKGLKAKLSLVDAAGKETPLAPDPKQGWRQQPRRQLSARVTLPEVADGDYLLRVRGESRLGSSTVDVPLAIYAPARVHLITDRPLYQPGDTVKFRALVLRARDLAPLDGRPGTWTVSDPSGETLLEEKAPAGPWGVVSGSFPLDVGAPEGTWHVSWTSGAATDALAFTVRPFTLPRFRIDAEALAPAYGPHERPVIRGHVVYSSGAPVAGAKLALTWSVDGAWPPPTSWLASALPRQLVADKDGAFTLLVPEVPGDLQGQATVRARIAATDASGDRVEGEAQALLSQDAIQVGTVTELADGLVEGFNNRLFLRATSASGEVLSGVSLRVQRAWDASDPGLEATTDEDGVASVQLDPGPAVNVIVPPLPFRPPPPPAQVTRGATRELISGEGASLADQKLMDGWLPALAPCARFGSQTWTVGLRVNASGAIESVGTPARPGPACVARALSGKRLAPGAERLYQVDFTFDDTSLPQLAVSLGAAPEEPDGLGERFQAAALEARGCLPAGVGDGILPEMATWKTTAGSRAVQLGWVRDPQRAGMSEAVATCVRGKLGPLTLNADATASDVGIARFAVSAAQTLTVNKPQATTWLGYELLVTATRAGNEIGHTRIRLAPGSVPALRLRATPVLAQAGQEVSVQLLRGPTFEGELPKKLTLTLDDHKPLEAEVDRATHTARFTLPADASGWAEIGGCVAQALVYIAPTGALAVQLTSEKDRYAPGQKAKLLLTTRVGGKGAQAAVGLFGVDQSMAQLATLPGADDLARVRPRIETSAPAFGTLDGQALVMGRIQGHNAAMATVLRVSSRPVQAERDAAVSGYAQGAFDPLAPLTDHFYDVLGELHVQARLWEEKAPAAEKMHPAGMVALWKKALAAVKARGGKIDDAYGRPLRLSRLPGDLLALTDPRAVILRGTRLPEDVESWSAYVAKEKP